MPTEPIASFVRRAASQEQFLEVIGRDEAIARFHRHVALRPCSAETVPLAASLGRVLASDIAAEVDAPAFDRSGVDGFALRAADTSGADEDTPRRLAVNPEVLACGVAPRVEVAPGTATVIATGAMIPRGADAVVMIEHSEFTEQDGSAAVDIFRSAAPGQYVTFAGSDIGRGEVVLRAGRLVTSREIGALAAIGRAAVPVVRRPRVAVLSTGDEIVPLGAPLRPGRVYDSNRAIIAAAVSECGGEPVDLGICRDDEASLEAALRGALTCDMVLVSGGTSKGAGDITYRVVGRLGAPGVIAHGVALKPGKPLCLAVIGKVPVLLLPGFPTSAIFTFHEFAAPVIRAFAGLRAETRASVGARLPLRIASERGRTEYVMVSLVRTEDGIAAYPTAKGSGAVTAFSQADGFVAVPQHAEAVAEGTQVDVQLIGRDLEPADLVIIGSHCIGLDAVMAPLERAGIRVKLLNVGSLGGIAAAKRGECDVAPVHLLDPASDTYNRPFLTADLALLPGYRRQQGILYRSGDARFAGKDAAAAVRAALADQTCVLVNRNAGSGTRILLDGLLDGARPVGYPNQAKTHNAVAAAIQQGRADWGLAIATVARQYGLAFIPLRDESYDFAIPRARLDRPAVRAFVAALAQQDVRHALIALGFALD
ncbi:MAG: molybdopterin biosynthesis protein [Alphaproteobacteria bacterium]|nr:molybdopterin biosynthesis protein [Alphaproteobacteria bacterium]